MKTSARTTLYKQICIILGIAVIALTWYVMSTPDNSLPKNTKVQESIRGYTGAMDTKNDPLKVPLTPTIKTEATATPIIPSRAITDS